ncbi:speckle-type POZ protein-like [Trichogramma pretiosum]|uniref:speckle-type POZ protein-like n=1 Tax=Trichogramma pretiosum TaxID=7493 RepID=UPI000C71A05D|nr:speckle-type POZ protein-like [Trichogramma pretiosum]
MVGLKKFEELSKELTKELDAIKESPPPTISIYDMWKLERFRYREKQVGKALSLPVKDMPVQVQLKFFPRGRVDGSLRSSIMLEYPEICYLRNVFEVDVTLRILKHRKVRQEFRKSFVTLGRRQENYWWLDLYEIAQERDLTCDEDGSLTIDCLVTVDPASAKRQDRENPFEFAEEDDERRYDFYRRLWGTEQFNDCVVMTLGGLVIPAHKIVLAAASPVLEALFKKKHKRMYNLRIYEAGKEAVVQLLFYAYTGRLKLCNDVRTLVELLTLAHAYGVKGLKLACQRRLIEHMDVDNCVDILRACARPDTELLKNAALDFFVKNVRHLRGRLKEIKDHDLYVAVINKMF